MLTCTRLISRFFSNAHHHGSLPQQPGVVWDRLLKTDPEGPTIISHAAYPHDWSVHDELLSVCACSTPNPKKSKTRPRGCLDQRRNSDFTGTRSWLVRSLPRENEHDRQYRRDHGEVPKGLHGL